LLGYPFWDPDQGNCVGDFVGASYNSFHYHTSVTAEFDTVETFGEHVGVVILTADVADL
jgi:hypothetical protein